MIGDKAKARISNRVFQKKRMSACQGVRNDRFSENLACFIFLKHPFEDFPFCLIIDGICFKNLEIRFRTKPLDSWLSNQKLPSLKVTFEWRSVNVFIQMNPKICQSKIREICFGAILLNLSKYLLEGRIRLMFRKD